MMAERETETDAREEAWVIATNPDFPIRARNVNRHSPSGPPLDFKIA